ncbi:lytic transglycosylase domain-containing protein [Neomoorella thermoacetica]|uniref:Soluble lytic murein transglycosylase n=2 Tax=Neomoorella thermoacetica TaxID=1525 RepID=A0A1J5JTQ0_NEOTH|nr:lytic transglycosylase domain-containing protein [Moorella thermoacetica]APC09045.1 soluble lytic murein transglycosylase precursor [Moorella thermoacetica]OIQ09441.1 soluble lytic murein transglycosylase precursor [Moorella thermoacetica]OIQ12429.1 soluble lytic murein transglycosylase precursor [Moorella thermoacetica]GAF24981.1 soluble lytic murein transglycosylase and related regulatory proteins [Moorella thermoacetica Y72]
MGLGRRLLWLLFLLALLAFLLPRAGRLLYPLPYRDSITTYAHREGLDPLLVAAVARVESKFDPRARSDQGAMGLMQLMPETARLAAGHLGLPFAPDRLYEPDYNLRLGSWYLARLLDEFGDVNPALAAYNGGRGHVHEWLDSGVWDGSYGNLRQIPFPETREFVRKVLRDYRIYRFLYSDVR